MSLAELNPVVSAKVLVLKGQNRVLVLRRSPSAPRRAMAWDLPGGIVEYGEDPIAAGVRETEEETRLGLDSLEVLDVRADMEDGYSITIFYEAKAPTGKIQLSHEHDQYKWATAQECERLQLPPYYIESIRLAVG